MYQRKLIQIFNLCLIFIKFFKTNYNGVSRMFFYLLVLTVFGRFFQGPGFFADPDRNSWKRKSDPDPDKWTRIRNTGCYLWAKSVPMELGASSPLSSGAYTIHMVLGCYNALSQICPHGAGCLQSSEQWRLYIWCWGATMHWAKYAPYPHSHSID